jgi:hypothetical protein
MTQDSAKLGIDNDNLANKFLRTSYPARAGQSLREEEKLCRILLQINYSQFNQ